MKKIIVKIESVTRTLEFEVDDNTADEEIDEMVLEGAIDYVSITWKEKK